MGEGATGQVIRLKDSDIVVKCCDSYNNPDGFEMLQNENSIYKQMSGLKEPLSFIPRYYGECEIHGQYFIALEFITGKPCDWRADSALKKKLKSCLKDLKKQGVTHQDLRPENVLLTSQGEIKLIDQGCAKYYGQYMVPYLMQPINYGIFVNITAHNWAIFHILLYFPTILATRSKSQYSRLNFKNITHSKV